MKYLGIDYGSKRVGLAVSDESGNMSFPLVVINNTEKLINEILDICDQKKVDEIVVGESKDFKMNDNEIMKGIAVLVEDLKKRTDRPIHMHPEFLTSVEAEQIQGKNDMLDASAAAIILKSFLDTKNNF